MSSTDARFAHILVADDSAVNCELLSDILEPLGYKVTAVDDGDKALRVLHQQPVDVALLDVMMPRRTGFAVCQAVKADPALRLIPVVLITGLSKVEDRIQGIECGADDFLNKPVRKEELLARVRSLLKLKHFTDELENAETVLFSLALSIEGKDPYTGGHCERLSKYSVALAERIGLPESARVALRRAGTVHDIGKVAVPEQILLKPGPLTADERRIMEQHPIVGERICAPLRSFRDVLPIIRHHHEKMDGSGYPDGLKGEQIPITVRVMTIVDIYDSLTTNRSYRRALSPQEAFRILHQETERGWWDAELLENLEMLLQGEQRLAESSTAVEQGTGMRTIPATGN
ncbi:MAG: response regulator [Acidobacteria bacterium]|nr:response regulator [Acidobacteriota bacterium]MCL5289362.1 response regulator [Acidobacteriota bacterium]